MALEFCFICTYQIYEKKYIQNDILHWTYLFQILSELWFQRVVPSGNYEIVAVSTDKNTF